jgi:hypothetical protein
MGLELFNDTYPYMQHQQLLFFWVGFAIPRGMIHPTPKGCGFSLPLDLTSYKNTR